MARLRKNEWNFASNAASHINELLRSEKFKSSPLGNAQCELTQYKGLKRLDLVIFDREVPDKPLITVETKVPWSAEGRTPYNFEVVKDAHYKASVCGARYFVTWNIRRAVTWLTDDPGVPLQNRVVGDQEIINAPLASAEDLSSAEFEATWKRGVEELVQGLHNLVVGPAQPSYLPLDKQFISRLEADLDFPITLTAAALAKEMAGSASFKRKAETWMRDRQGWTVSSATSYENTTRAARFTCYVLVNRLCFYGALRRKYPKLRKLTLGRGVTTAKHLKEKLAEAFANAMRFTGDYETVFETDTGDEFPFLSDASVGEWKRLIESLETYDFASIDLEVIGAMYEQLIRPEERYRYGQHYTKPEVVDLINSFAIKSGDAKVLDPGCGGGTFLVRAYARKRHLESAQTHAGLLAALYGCDILRYACHLSVINLAVRDLVDDDNFPQIHAGDFLDVTGSSVFAALPTRIVAGGLPTGVREVLLPTASCDAVVGNPPYIQARNLPTSKREGYLKQARREWPGYEWSPSSDIFVWFFTHGATFIRSGGVLALLTQAGWLDIEYGVPLQKWMLDNFRILAIVESEVEPWFTDARVATAITILVREADPNARASNLTRFVQFREPLPRGTPNASEGDRQRLAESLRDAILATTRDSSDPRFRIRVMRQSELLRSGVAESGAGYVGSKWGRYLRAIDVVYEMQRDHPDRFCALGGLAKITRGITTNCDDFFIVTDVSEASLSADAKADTFKVKYGVKRSDVLTGKFKIVRRRDGVVLPLEADKLVPTLTTARDQTVRLTSQLKLDSFLVQLAGPRAKLSNISEQYVLAGEREHWHESASFTGKAEWFVARQSEIAPVLFVKTIQYAPLVFLNDGKLTANQRLYGMHPVEDVDDVELAAMLNSTLFAAERLAGAKALGREAANDVEVFTARQFRVPDVRTFPAAERRRMRSSFERLSKRPIGPLLEKTLTEAGLHEARVYVERNPVSAAVWPEELADADRQEIDSAILRSVGVANADVKDVLNRLYNEVVAFTRRARLLELEAMENRRGATGDGPTASALGDDVWAELIQDGLASVRTVPDGFMPPGVTVQNVVIPNGRPERVDGDLFRSGTTIGLQFGKGATVEFTSAGQRELALLLIGFGTRGPMSLPSDEAACTAMRDAIAGYLTDVTPKVRKKAEEITENPDLREKIYVEAMKRLRGGR